MRCLMIINLYKITGEELGKLKNKQQTERHTYKWLPKYCIKPDGSIDQTQYWLQFTDSGSDIFYLFDVVHTDQPLEYEVEQMGFDDFKFDFNFLKDFACISYEDMHNKIPLQTHIVFDLHYDGQGEDTDLTVNIMGYLDNHLELKSI